MRPEDIMTSANRVKGLNKEQYRYSSRAV